MGQQGTLAVILVLLTCISGCIESMEGNWEALACPMQQHLPQWQYEPGKGPAKPCLLRASPWPWTCTASRVAHLEAPRMFARLHLQQP